MLLSGAAGTWVFAAIILKKLEAGSPISSLFEGYAWLLVFMGGLVSAIGLFGLRGWAWVSAIVVESLACLMTVLPELSFSWAALFHGAIALSLLQPKTRYVVTPEYRRIIAQTPKAKRGTSAVAKVLLVMIVLLLGLGIAASFLRQ